MLQMMTRRLKRYREKILVITVSFILLLIAMGNNVIAAEKNSITYEYANDEKTQIKAVGYVPSDYAESYADDLIMGNTFTSGGITYPIVGIDTSAFANTKLCSVLIKERGTTFFIGNNAFENVNVQKRSVIEAGGSITISCDVDTIGEYAFSNAVVSNNICFEGDVGTIEAYAFQNITAGGYMDFQGKIDIVGEYAMSNMQIAGFKRIQIREIGKGAFSDNAMTTWHHLEGLEIVGDNAFEDCTELVDMTFPETVISIGSNCFKGCMSLESITLPANPALTIGENAFPNQEGLKIIIPSEVTEINNYNFNTLTNVVFQIDVDCSATVTQYFEENGLQYQKGEDGEVIKGGATEPSEGDEENSPNDQENVEDTNNSSNSQENAENTDNSSNSQENTENTDNFSNNQENPGDTSADNTGNIGETDTTGIGETLSQKETVQKGKSYTYKNMIYKVTGSSTVTFMKPVSKKVKKITIPSKVKILGKSFKVTKVNKKACYKCNKLTSVTIGDNVTTINDQAFANCGKLQKVTIGKGLKKLGKKVFYKNSKLKVLTIKSSKLTSVGKGTLKGVKNLTVKAPKKKVSKYNKLFKKAK